MYRDLYQVPLVTENDDKASRNLNLQFPCNNRKETICTGHLWLNIGDCSLAVIKNSEKNITLVELSSGQTSEGEYKHCVHPTALKASKSVSEKWASVKLLSVGITVSLREAFKI